MEKSDEIPRAKVDTYRCTAIADADSKPTTTATSCLEFFEFSVWAVGTFFGDYWSSYVCVHGVVTLSALT